MIEGIAYDLALGVYELSEWGKKTEEMGIQPFIMRMEQQIRNLYAYLQHIDVLTFIAHDPGILINLTMNIRIDIERLFVEATHIQSAALWEIASVLKRETELLEEWAVEEDYL